MSQRRDDRERRRWEAEMVRRMEALDRLDEEHGLGADLHLLGRSGPARQHRAATKRRVAVPAGVAVALVALVVAALPSVGLSALFELDVLGGGDASSYAFLAHQPGRPEDPVSYDACQPLRYRINLENAPSGAEELVAEAVEVIAEASGLDLQYVGTTTDPPYGPAGGQIAGTRVVGARPVTVSWGTEAEFPGLAGRVAGRGGSRSADVNGRRWWITGDVLLDAAVFHRLVDGPWGRRDRDDAKAIIIHELAHVVGLDHVTDRTQLMYDDNDGQHGLGNGDEAGLAALGGHCM